jgi:hypothetical protein
MRIDISFKDFRTKATRHETLSVAQAFVNDGLGERYYGPGMTWIELAVQSHSAAGRKLKRTRRYPGSFAEHVLYEVEAEFGPANELSPDDFRAALALVEACIASSSDCWAGEFRLGDFQADIRCLAKTAPADAEALKQYARLAPSLRQRIELKWLRADERRRFESPRPLTHQLGGLRCYPSGRLAGILEPYASNYCRLFEGLLRAARWLTPGYSEIYVNLDESDELARLNRSAIESWHENAYAAIDLEEFQAADAQQKDALVFEAYCTALGELARVDHLDQAALNAAIERISREGLDAELVYLSNESDSHRVRIVYRLSRDGGTPAFRLVVEEMATGKIAERDLEVRPEEELWLAYRFGKLELTKKEVRIRARTGERAATFLKSVKRPPVEAFALKEMFGGP